MKNHKNNKNNEYMKEKNREQWDNRNQDSDHSND